MSQDDDDCFYDHSWRSNVVITKATPYVNRGFTHAADAMSLNTPKERGNCLLESIRKIKYDIIFKYIL